MTRGLTRSVVLVAVVLLALGVGGVGGVAGEVAVAETAAECETEADNALVGCWNGTHHSDDPAALGIDQSEGSDGLTEEQLADLTALKMARVESIRERPFESAVPVDVVSRERFAEDRAAIESDPEFARWNDQVWKALFVIGEDESSEEVINEVFSGAVAGFYSPAEDRIVIVVDDEEDVRVSPTTLLHELGHAMQDQYDDLSDPRYAGATQDADLGIDGAVEGEVVYLEAVYAERCAEEWACTPEPPDRVDDEPGSDAGEPNLGVLLTVLQPYSDGAPYVDELIEAGGWDAVDELMADPPATTRETIHREPFEPTPIEFVDTAEGGWETYENAGVDGADTVGEASLFVSLWYQSSAYGAGVMDHNDLFDTNHPYQDYNYSHPVTNGWANDELYPYRNDADGGGDADGAGDVDGTNGAERDGYVWVIEWETAADAATFQEAYLQVLDAGDRDAEHRADGTYYVADGEFRGAYGVERNGTTLTIAHALESESVFELRPDIDLDRPDPDPDEGPDSGVPDAPTVEYGDDRFPPVEPGDPIDPSDSDDDAVGFGVLAALIALVVTLLAARREARV